MSINPTNNADKIAFGKELVLKAYRTNHSELKHQIQGFINYMISERIRFESRKVSYDLRQHAFTESSYVNVLTPYSRKTAQDVYKDFDTHKMHVFSIMINNRLFNPDDPKTAEEQKREDEINQEAIAFFLKHNLSTTPQELEQFEKDKTKYRYLLDRFEIFPTFPKLIKLFHEIIDHTLEGEELKEKREAEKSLERGRELLHKAYVKDKAKLSQICLQELTEMDRSLEKFEKGEVKYNTQEFAFQPSKKYAEFAIEYTKMSDATDIELAGSRVVKGTVQAKYAEISYQFKQWHMGGKDLEEIRLAERILQIVEQTWKDNEICQSQESRDIGNYLRSKISLDPEEDDKRLRKLIEFKIIDGKMLSGTEKQIKVQKKLQAIEEEKRKKAEEAEKKKICKQVLIGIINNIESKEKAAAIAAKDEKKKTATADDKVPSSKSSKPSKPAVEADSPASEKIDENPKAASEVPKEPTKPSKTAKMTKSPDAKEIKKIKKTDSNVSEEPSKPQKPSQNNVETPPPVVENNNSICSRLWNWFCTPFRALWKLLFG